MAIILIRTVIVFACLILSMRLMGKRQLGELELSELVVAVLISNIASNPLEDNKIPLINAILPILILLCCELIISAITLRSTKMRGLLFGRPSILIKNGKIDQQAMKKNRVSADELAEAMRSNGITDISKVRYAILETDGEVNILPYAASQPVTPENLNLSVDDNGIPHIVINNGKMLNDNLTLIGRNNKWLENELKRRNISTVAGVYLMSVDDSGKIYISTMEKQK